MSAQESLKKRDTTTSAVIAARFEGPLPPPNILKQYDGIVPGSAEKIIGMAEKNQQHQINMDDENQRRAKMELKYAFIFGLLGQLGTIVIALSGFVFAYFQPKLAVAGFALSATVVGYLIWWKTKNSQ